MVSGDEETYSEESGGKGADVASSCIGVSGCTSEGRDDATDNMAVESEGAT